MNNLVDKYQYYVFQEQQEIYVLTNLYNLYYKTTGVFKYVKKGGIGTL